MKKICLLAFAAIFAGSVPAFAGMGTGAQFMNASDNNLKSSATDPRAVGATPGSETPQKTGKAKKPAAKHPQ